MKPLTVKEIWSDQSNYAKFAHKFEWLRPDTLPTC